MPVAESTYCSCQINPTAATSDMDNLVKAFGFWFVRSWLNYKRRNNSINPSPYILVVTAVLILKAT
jgi:hypothetical protein